jgi:hypothetical protein
MTGKKIHDVLDCWHGPAANQQVGGSSHPESGPLPEIHPLVDVDDSSGTNVSEAFAEVG